ncbi:hypothetical protein [Novosphingobium sp.]|uniref:hypothetical protein n=1 Tax=Novosphingobium sp. TaxID=1874826 RepID=UPI003BA856BC
MRDMLDLLGSGNAANAIWSPARRKPGRRAPLDGNFARRKLPLRKTEYCIWDTGLAGCGLASR